MQMGAALLGRTLSSFFCLGIGLYLVNMQNIDKV